ncbi:conserved hypothetical protein [Rhodococcus ruber]|uniref:Uncharacterized protein n=1 Tax=Rhodococcus ruber TaxID=1830 RepID=A0A098BVD2_9NOCA|nr:conserved hypothetical protein [Rhodococcus ruber]
MDPHDGLDVAGCPVGFECFGRPLEREPGGDHRVEVDAAGGGEGDGRRPGVGVPEDAGEDQLAVLDQLDRQVHRLGAGADEDDGAGGPHGPHRGGDRGGGAGGVDVGVDVQVGDVVGARVEGGGRPELPGQRATVRVEVGDDDVGGAEGAGDLRGDDADGAGAGDEHPGSGGDARLADGGDAHGQRFAEGGRVVGDGVGDGMGEFRPDGDVVAEGAVDGWGGVEPHVRAEVVATAPGFLGGRVGSLRLDRHALPDPFGGDAGTDRGDRAGGLVAEDERGLDDEFTDAALAVVVRVRSAHADRGDPDEHVAGCGFGDRALAHLDPSGFDQDGGAHALRDRRGCCVGHSADASVLSR